MGEASAYYHFPHSLINKTLVYLKLIFNPAASAPFPEAVETWKEELVTVEAPPSAKSTKA